MMQPTAASTGPISVSLTPAQIKAAAGAPPVELNINVRNMGADADQFSVELEGIDPSWYTIQIQSVALFPGDSAPLPVRLHPPQGGVKPGDYPFTVRARSQSNPNLVGQAKGVVTVGSFANFQVEVTPKRVTAFRGKFKANINNAGSGPVQLRMSGKDPQGKLAFSFHPSTPTVQPGQRGVSSFTVRKKGLFNFVGEEERIPFTIVGQPTDGTEQDARETQAEFVHKPIFATWRWPIIIFAALLLALLWAIFRPSLNPCSPRFLLPSNLHFYSGFLCSGTELAATAPPEKVDCVSGQGFREVRENYERIVGACIEDEWYDTNLLGPNGNAHQRTQSGRLLFVRKGNEAQIYFFGNDARIYTFVNCDPGKFTNCDIVEVLKEETQK